MEQNLRRGTIDRRFWLKNIADFSFSFSMIFVLVRDVFGRSIEVQGDESGGGEALANLIVKGKKNITIKIRDKWFFILPFPDSDSSDVYKPIDLLFLCAKSRHDALPKRLNQEKEKIRFEEIFVYETIPSETLAEELNEFLKNEGVIHRFQTIFNRKRNTSFFSDRTPSDFSVRVVLKVSLMLVKNSNLT